MMTPETKTCAESAGAAGVRTAPYRTLEAWRGFASIWVVLYHAAHATLVRFPGLSITPVYAFSQRGSLGVQMFFVISGYCIAAAACNALRRPDGFPRFMRARVRRIYPPYWVVWVFAAAFSVLASELAKARHLGPSYSAANDVLHKPVWYYLSNLALGQVAAHVPSLVSQSWTLCYEIAFYLLVGLVFLIPRLGGSERALLNTLHAVTLASLLWLTLAPQFRFFPLDLWPQFGLGAIVYDLVSHPRQKWLWAWLLAAVVLCAAFLFAGDLPFGPERESSRVTFAVALGFSLLILCLHRFDEMISRWRLVQAFSYVGLFSYSLYLIHMLVIGIVNQGARLTKLPERLDLVVFAISLLASLAAGRLFYQFCERPFVKPVFQPTSGAWQKAEIVGHTAE
jgi:exopolysaccharide production protein ExoZ